MSISLCDLMRIEADYYDGKSARRVAATVTVVGRRVVVGHDGVSSEYALDAIHVQPRLRGAPRRVEFPDGSAAITDDHVSVDAAFGVGSAHTLAHRLESNLSFVFAAMIGVVVAVALGYVYGVPWVAREVAERLPLNIESQLAEVGMKSLDQAIFEPTALDADTRQKIAKAFVELRAATDLPATVRLEFRDGGWIGANALALPGGVVVVTDQLVDGMPGLDETMAVLAHELGHVRHRHSLRHLLQDSITALAASAIYGDVASLTSIAVTAPTVLAHNGYSRDFEREADTFAFDLLKKTGRSPKSFASALTAMEKARDRPSDPNKLRRKLGLPDKTPQPERAPKPERPPKEKGGFGYLSTHPATEERIRAAEAAEGAP
jgi:Zn-dependent protease with chaperone function